MRLRHIKGCEEYVNSSEWTIVDPKEYKGKWQHPIHVEIGMGKGRFIRDMAKLNPDIFYLGIERYESVIQKAIERKLKEDEERIAEGLDKYENLRFVCMDALELPEVFDEGEVDKIYLNFSDPWPKARHEHRRLTSPIFMKLYDRVLSKDGVVEFKTDNEALFDYSLESIPASGWELTYVTRDLHSEDIPNVMTEYEEKFSSKGNRIFKLAARR